jgi:hypothetical protein
MDGSEPVAEGALAVVWNASQGWQQAVFDSLHKWISPQTYSCNLCRLTHGLTGPREAWKSFLETLDRPVLFYHKDEFENAGIQGDFSLEFPMILSFDRGNWEVVMDASVLDGIRSLEELLAELKNRLSPGPGIPPG